MSQRSRRASTSVSLFPFLAVLVCAMGALILLLLVTTRRVRQQVIASQRPPTVETVPAKPARPPAAPPRAVSPQSSKPESLAQQRAERARAREEVRAQMEQEWEGRLAELEALRDQRQNQQRQQQERLRRVQEGLKLARAELLNTEKQRAAVRQAVLEEKQTESETKAEVIALSEDIKFAKEQLLTLRKRRADAQSQFAFIPYDGESGTTRRPIYVECTGAGLRILPEDESLRGRDLSGFTERYNPLLLGVESLIAYWAGQASLQPEKPDEEPPYVLLLVRPEGSRTFYIARQFLAQLKQPYGYELVEEGFPLYMPPPDPQAKLILKSTIEQTLWDRAEVIESISGRRRNPGKIIEFDSFGSGGDGDDLPGTPQGGRGTGQRGSDPYGGGGQGGQGSSEEGTGNGFTGNSLTGNGGGLNGDNVASGGSSGQRSTGNRGNGFSNGSGSRTVAGAGFGSRGTGSGARPQNGGVPESPDDVPYAPLGLGPEGKDGNEPGGGGNSGKPTDRDMTAGNPNGRNREGAVSSGEFPGGSSRRGEFDDLNGRGVAAVPEGSGGRAAPSGSYSEEGPTSGSTGRRSSTNTSPRGSSMSGQSSSSGGQTQSGQGPTPVVEFGPKKKKLGRDDLPKRWGPVRRGMIGYEKTINIQVTADQMIVGDNEFDIPVGRGESREELVNEIVAAIEQHSQGWGEPPTNFYWIPAVKFRVFPGGIRNYERVHPQLRELGLFSKVDFAVDEKPPEDPRNQKPGVKSFEGVRK